MAADDHVTFQSVRLNGILVGSLTLTDDDIAFVEGLEDEVVMEDDQTSTTTSTTHPSLHLKRSSWQWQWPLACIQENLIIKPVSCTVELSFMENCDVAPPNASLPDGEDTVSFRLPSLNEVLRFRTAMTEKIIQNRSKRKPSNGSCENSVLVTGTTLGKSIPKSINSTISSLHSTTSNNSDRGQGNAAATTSSKKQSSPVALSEDKRGTNRDDGKTNGNPFPISPTRVALHHSQLMHSEPSHSAPQLQQYHLQPPHQQQQYPLQQQPAHYTHQPQNHPFQSLRHPIPYQHPYLQTPPPNPYNYSSAGSFAALPPGYTNGPVRGASYGSGMHGPVNFVSPYFPPGRQGNASWDWTGMPYEYGGPPPPPPGDPHPTMAPSRHSQMHPTMRERGGTANPDWNRQYPYRDQRPLERPYPVDGRGAAANSVRHEFHFPTRGGDLEQVGGRKSGPMTGPARSVSPMVPSGRGRNDRRSPQRMRSFEGSGPHNVVASQKHSSDHSVDGSRKMSARDPSATSPVFSSSKSGPPRSAAYSASLATTKATATQARTINSRSMLRRVQSFKHMTMDTDAFLEKERASRSLHEKLTTVTSDSGASVTAPPTATRQRSTDSGPSFGSGHNQGISSPRAISPRPSTEYLREYRERGSSPRRTADTGATRSNAKPVFEDIFYQSSEASVSSAASITLPLRNGSTQSVVQTSLATVSDASRQLKQVAPNSSLTTGSELKNGISAKMLSTNENREIVTSGSASELSASSVRSSSITYRGSRMSAAQSDKNMQRPAMKKQDLWKSLNNERNSQNNSDDHHNLQALNQRATEEDDVENCQSKISRDREHVVTTVIGMATIENCRPAEEVSTNDSDSDDEKTDQHKDLMSTFPSSSCVGKHRSLMQDDLDVSENLPPLLPNTGDDSEVWTSARRAGSSNEGIRSHQESGSKYAGGEMRNSKSDAAQNIKSDLPISALDLHPGEHGRRRLLKYDASDDGLVDLDAVELPVTENDIELGASRQAGTDALAASPFVIHVDRGPGRAERGQDRRRLLRTTSSERQLVKPPSLVKREMARLGSRRNLMRKGSENDEEQEVDMRSVWKKPLETRKAKLSNRSLLSLEKGSDNNRKAITRSNSDRNMHRPSLIKKESFASARSRHSDGEMFSDNVDESEDPDESVWKIPGRGATRPGIQHVAGTPHDRRLILKERQYLVRQDLENLGSSRKLGSSRSLVSLRSTDSSLNATNDDQSIETSADSQSRVSGEELQRPSDEKAHERPTLRAIKPGAQHIDTPLISHSMAKMEMARVGGQGGDGRMLSLAMHDGGSGLAVDEGPISGCNEESKEEIREELNSVMSEPGTACTRNDHHSTIRDDISAEAKPTMHATCSIAPSSDLCSHDSGVDEEVGEKVTSLGRDPKDGNKMVDHGVHVLANMETGASSLIEATLVDDGAEIVAAITVDPKQELRRRRKVYAMVTIGCGSLALFVTVIVVVFGRGTTPASPPPLTPEERYELFSVYFRGVVHNSTLLNDPTSPQSQALLWMSTVDTMYENPTAVSNDDLEKLNQRYCLAVFFHTMTQVKQWEYCRPPETGESNACVHPITESYGVEGVYYNQQEREPTFRWLSNVDECKWGGVRCDDNRHASHLRLANTKLAGTLPVEVVELRNLQVLDLQQNSLMGTLPGEWGEMAMNGSSYVSIRLDSNRLVGPIPDSWCHLNHTSLTELILANNGLTGTIPSCLMNLKAMEDFSVKDNILTGTIPTELGDLLKLQTIHMSGNNFTGKMPDELCSLESIELFEASTDCINILSDRYVQCPCCTKCCDGGEETCLLAENFRNF